MNARIDALVNMVEAERSDNPPPTLMTATTYAKHADASVPTVRRWLKEGMPCRRRGKHVRVIVAEADRWRRTDHIRESAEHEAHRGRR